MVNSRVQKSEFCVLQFHTPLVFPFSAHRVPFVGSPNSASLHSYISFFCNVLVLDHPSHIVCVQPLMKYFQDWIRLRSLKLGLMSEFCNVQFYNCPNVKFQSAEIRILRFTVSYFTSISVFCTQSREYPLLEVRILHHRDSKITYQHKICMGLKFTVS